MKDADFQLPVASDPRLLVHANGALPAWLWSGDGIRILWANSAGVDALGAHDGAQLIGKTFGPADPHRRQIAQMAGQLNPNGAIRMERLRGFGAPPGALATCSCSRIEFPDGRSAVLIVSAARVARKRVQPSAFAAASEPTRDDGLLPSAPAPISAVEDEGLAPTQQASAEFTLFDPFAEDEAPASRPDTPPQDPSAAHPTAPSTKTSGEHQPATTSEALPLTDAEERPPSVDLHQPFRFEWHTDREDRFSISSHEFLRLIGPLTESLIGRPWRAISGTLGLDADARLQKALAARDAFSGITLNWPVDGGYLPVELSGAPLFDDVGRFAGYRGVGLCRDLHGLARLDMLRRHGISISPPNPQPPSSDSLEEASIAAGAQDTAGTGPLEKSSSTDLDEPVDTPQDTSVQTSDRPAERPAEPPHNVLPFRPVGEAKPPVLSPIENSAFDELARRLSARLDSDDPAGAEPTELAAEPETTPAPPPPSEGPDWLAPPEPPARGESRRDKALLDLLPAGVLIYRLDRLLYANPAFLKRIGYASLHALEDAGGLDALFVEPGVSTSSSTSEAGTPVSISVGHAEDVSEATAARLHAISWDDEAALALICSEGPVDAAPVPAPPVAPDPAVQALPTAAGEANAEELGAILDTTTEGIVMFDEEGNITACNRSAEALFGYDGEDFIKRNLSDLFAPESQHGVFEYFSGVKSADVTSLLDHGRETLGRVRQGGFVPLSITIGRTRADGPNFFAVFRDLSQSRKSENELQQAKRLTERAASAKSDMLARISHELRAPLNAIIGFAEVMIGERFGALGNDRYAEYLKDIRASGQRVISVIDDLLDLSKVEAGKIDLSFASQNLNELVESCVAVLQPQANRERIIIRTSLAHTLPPVVADARALRQIAMNLIGTSIHLAKAGGQVIVSTAVTDFGDVALRVRDTGTAMNDNEVAAALEPFGMRGPPDRLSDASAVSLSLTKALAEANRAQFNIRPGPHTGTLVEVVFSRQVAQA